jgi:hypothetical protein
MIITGYSELRILLKEIGDDFKDDGSAEENIGKQVVLNILGQNGGQDMELYFDIKENGEEIFVCQQD